MTLMTLWVCRTLLYMTALDTMILTALSLPPSAMADSTDRWQTLIEAGIAAHGQARYEDAERWFLSAGHEATQFASDDPRVAETLNHLGLVYHAQEQYERAKPYYEEALARWERVLGSGHRDVASVLNNLEEIYQEQGAFEQAEA